MPLDLHDVVRHQPVAAVDEVQRALRLADAALPHDQDAQAEHVDEHGVEVQAQGQPLLEERGERLDEGRRLRGRREDRDPARLRLRAPAPRAASRPLVTTKQEMPAGGQALQDGAAARRRSSLRRYPSSLPPRICTRP